MRLKCLLSVFSVIVRSLVKRGNMFPSDEQERRRETKYIEGALQANNYPKHFIQKTRRRIQVREVVREAEGRNTDDQDGQRKPFVVLPYVRSVTEKVTRILKPHAKVATKPGRNLKNVLVRPKDQREKDQNSGLVYQYECECGKVYVWETCRTIRTREREHKRAIRNLDADHSGISKHVLETGHTIVWDGVKILTYERDWKKRKIKEGISIAKTRNDMLLNTRPGIPVADVYRVLR